MEVGKERNRETERERMREEGKGNEGRKPRGILITLLVVTEIREQRSQFRGNRGDANLHNFQEHNSKDLGTVPHTPTGIFRGTVTIYKHWSRNQ